MKDCIILTLGVLGVDVVVVHLQGGVSPGPHYPHHVVEAIVYLRTR